MRNIDIEKEINDYFGRMGGSKINESPRQVINNLRVEFTPLQVIEKLTSFIETLESKN